MKRPDLLIRNTRALVRGADGHYAETDAEIAISDGIILSMHGAPEGFSPDRVLDGTGKLCIPGLINCHTHLYMSLFRNAADDVAFDEWLFRRILPREETLTAEDAYWGTLLSCIELLKRGTTCFCDMHMFPGVPARAARKAGLRAVVSRGLTGSEGGERRVSEALGEWEEVKDDPLTTFMLAPHAIYTCDEAFLRRIADLSGETGLPIHTHLAESVKESADCYREHGCSPAAYLDRVGILSHKTLAAHCVQLSESDIRLLAARGVSVAHNPKSNLKLANGVAPVRRMLEQGVNVCLGTDGAGSNNAQNLFSEMNFACLLPKGIERDGAAVSAEEVFAMATENGAKALSLEKVGRLEEGWQADIVLLDLHRPAFSPPGRTLRALCYAADGSEVETVLVGGQVVLDRGVLPFIDEEEVYFHVAKITKDW